MYISIFLLIIILLIVYIGFSNSKCDKFKGGISKDFIHATGIGSKMLLSIADIINAGGDGRQDTFYRILREMKQMTCDTFNVTIKKLEGEILHYETENGFKDHLLAAARKRSSTAVGWSDWIVDYYDGRKIVLETDINVYILTRDNKNQIKIENYKITLIKNDGKWCIVEQIFATKQLISMDP